MIQDNYIISFEKKMKWKDILRPGFKMGEGRILRTKASVVTPIYTNEYVNLIRKSDGKMWRFELQ